MPLKTFLSIVAIIVVATGGALLVKTMFNKDEPTTTSDSTHSAGATTTSAPTTTSTLTTTPTATSATPSSDSVEGFVGSAIHTDFSDADDVQFVMHKKGKVVAFSVGTGTGAVALPTTLPSAIPASPSPSQGGTTSPTTTPPSTTPPSVPPSANHTGLRDLARNYASAFWGADWKDLFPETHQQIDALDSRVGGVETKLGEVETATGNLTERVRTLETDTLPQMEERLGQHINGVRDSFTEELNKRDTVLQGISETLGEVSKGVEDFSRKVDDRMEAGNEALKEIQGQLESLTPPPTTKPSEKSTEPDGPKVGDYRPQNGS